MAALGQLDLAAVARPFLVDLAERVNGAVLLVVPHGDRATIVDKVDGGRVAVEVSAGMGDVGTYRHQQPSSVSPPATTSYEPDPSISLSLGQDRPTGGQEQG